VTAAISRVTQATGAPTGTSAAIAFNNKPTTNQDACEGATVAFSYTSG